MYPVQYNGPITRSQIRTARSRAVAPAFQPRINTLPLEILAAIFILALPSDEQILKWDHRVPIWEKPIKLCAVCSLW